MRSKQDPRAGRLVNGAPASPPAQPSGGRSGKHLPGERSIGEAHRRVQMAVVLGWRDGALVVAEGVVAVATEEEVLDPRAAAVMQEEVVVGVVTVVVGAAHASNRRVGSQSGPTRTF
ncbi:MAG: hypothetical protein ACJ8CN_14385 [Gemmatimonadales bacterium]